MKVKKVVANNRKKAFEILTSRKTFDFPYSRLEWIPSATDSVVKVYPDPEIAYDGFTYELASGKEGTVLLDQVLEYAKDPNFMRTMLLYRLTIEAQKRIKDQGLSKREVIRRMGTTPTQFYRLIDQKNVRKTIDQMIKLLAALDCSVDLVFGRAA